MKILQTLTLQGPSYWSSCQTKLILVQLDLGNLGDRTSDDIPGFYEGLASILPSLEAHFCTPGCEGGFLRRVLQGIGVASIVERVALELQTLANIKVKFGRTCGTVTPGVYQVAIEYQGDAAGRYALRAAVRLCRSILETGDYPKAELAKDLEDLAQLRAEASLGASTEALVREAETLGIPWVELETCNLFQFGYGKYQKRIQASLTSYSNLLGVELASNKESTKKILASMGVPVPQGEVIYAFRDLEDAIDCLGGYPIVIKPLNGNHGRGITIDIQTWRQAKVAYDRARDVSSGVIVEHFYQGRDHRILVVDHKVVAVAERVPAHVVGTGQASIWALVAQENQDPRRGQGHDNVLTQIQLDRATDEMLRRQGYTLDTILPVGQICYLRATANISTGGIAIDRTDEIHADTVWMAERVSRIIGLDIAGIDVITTDITKPLAEAGGVIVEVNAAPGLRMHVAPSQGVGRNVAAPILKMLFPPGVPTRIPIVAVAGNNSNAAPTPLIAHILGQVHDAVGFTTTEGVYVGTSGGPKVYPLTQADTTPPQRSWAVLQDPTVEIAVLETTRDEILHSGLAFQYCDVGVVLNVAGDQLGVEDIDAVHPLININAVVAEIVRPEGYAVLNADDAQVAAMAQRVVGKVAYFSMDPDNALVRSHVQQGGIAAVYEKGHLAILQDDWVYQIEAVDRIPSVLGGCTPFMIAQTLAASLTAFVLGVKVEQIRAALHCFQLASWQAPEQITNQMPLFNQNYYQLDLPRVDSAFNAKPTPQLKALNALALSKQASTVVASAIALENWQQRKNQHPVIPQVNLSTVRAILSEERQESPMPQKTHVEPVPHQNHTIPILMQVALKIAKKVAKQALDIGEIIGTVAIAFSSVAAEVALNAGKKWGAIAWTKLRKQYS